MAAVEQREATTAEGRLSQQVRQAALSEIEARQLGESELAPILGLSQTALYLLSLKESWPLAVSVHIAESLGLRIDVTVSDDDASAGARAA